MKKKQSSKIILLAVILILIGVFGLVISTIFNKYTVKEIENKTVINSSIDNPIMLSGKLKTFSNDEYGYEITLPEEMNINEFNQNSYGVYFYDEQTGRDTVYYLLVAFSYPKELFEPNFEEILNDLKNNKIGYLVEVPFGDMGSYTYYEKIAETNHGDVIYYRTEFEDADNSLGYFLRFPKLDNYISIELSTRRDYSLSIEENNKQLVLQRKLFDDIVNSLDFRN